MATARPLVSEDASRDYSMSAPTFLTGFAGVANWTAVHLVDTLPPLRSCHLCGVVPDTTCVLECSHSFCIFCYNRILAKGRTCPLDQESFHEEETGRFIFKQNQLKKLKSRCPNFKYGCEFVGDVLTTLDHLNECASHAIACWRCNQNVARGNIIDHFTGGCRSTLQAVRSTPAQDTLLDSVTKAGANIQRDLELMSHAQLSVQDSVNNLTSEITASTRDLKVLIAAHDSKQAFEQMKQGVNSQLERLCKSNEELKKECKATLVALGKLRVAEASTSREVGTAASQSGLSSSAVQARVRRTVLRKVKDLPAESSKGVKCVFTCDPLEIGDFTAFFIVLFTNYTNYIYLVQRAAGNAGSRSLCDAVDALNVVHPNISTIAIKIHMEQLAVSRHWLPCKVCDVTPNDCVVACANFLSVAELQRLGYMPNQSVAIDVEIV
ncbi:uncharacterized protein LOC135383141 [Ornithodoros turicata]|uniref:uncharacterized protein LOC135383141 n=1 Tax=Ornithodoros turicata TaxID=34597 RepID=UPI00313A2461